MSELWVILIFLVLNAVFVMSETAMTASRRARLQQQVERGNEGAKVAMSLSEQPNRFLSTIQIGITLIGILMGALGEASISRNLERQLADTSLAPYASLIAFIITVLIISYFSLIIGELVPKRLALLDPEGVASRVAPAMRLLSIITSPIVKLLSASTDAVLWLLRVRPKDDPIVTEDEITTMMQQGVQAGVFEEAEHEMVEGVFSLSERKVTAIMTPRTDVVWLDIDDDTAINQRKIGESHFSRFPVCEGDLDKVIGMVRAKDLLPRLLNGEPFDLRAAMVPPLFVPESMTAAKAVDMFRETGKHIVFVLNEYGGLQGLVTTQDILNEIVGESGAPESVQREDGSFIVDAMMAVDDFKDLFKINQLPGEHEHFETLAGFVMMQQGEIPRAGDHFIWEDLRFEVVDMDGNRIDKMLVNRVKEQSSKKNDEA
jgi:putative hemolysin